MPMRPDILSGSPLLSRGYRKRQGYGDAWDGLPQFSSDRNYLEGYNLGIEHLREASATAHIDQQDTSETIG
ncbi:hypothetical protein D3C71_538600 [compost metagenome]